MYACMHADGQVLQAEGREVIMRDPGAQEWPWPDLDPAAAALTPSAARVEQQAAAVATVLAAELPRPPNMAEEQARVEFAARVRSHASGVWQYEEPIAQVSQAGTGANDTGAVLAVAERER
jgi:hypothetical protein